MVNKKPKKAEKKSPESLEPTEAFWTREDYVKRRTRWVWRLGIFVKKKYCEICKSCQYQDRCHRVPLNERIMAKLILTGKCPDYKTIWKTILEDEPYDWGF